MFWYSQINVYVIVLSFIFEAFVSLYTLVSELAVPFFSVCITHHLVIWRRNVQMISHHLVTRWNTDADNIHITLSIPFLRLSALLFRLRTSCIERDCRFLVLLVNKWSIAEKKNVWRKKIERKITADYMKSEVNFPRAVYLAFYCKQCIFYASFKLFTYLFVYFAKCTLYALIIQNIKIDVYKQWDQRCFCFCLQRKLLIHSA